jgi:hypothetical protein
VWQRWQRAHSLAFMTLTPTSLGKLLSALIAVVVFFCGVIYADGVMNAIENWNTVLLFGKQCDFFKIYNGMRVELDTFGQYNTLSTILHLFVCWGSMFSYAKAGKFKYKSI